MIRLRPGTTKRLQHEDGVARGAECGPWGVYRRELWKLS
jgi:hypothetical protein